MHKVLEAGKTYTTKNGEKAFVAAIVQPTADQYRHAEQGPVAVGFIVQPGDTVPRPAMWGITGVWWGQKAMTKEDSINLLPKTHPGKALFDSLNKDEKIAAKAIVAATKSISRAASTLVKFLPATLSRSEAKAELLYNYLRENPDV